MRDLKITFSMWLFLWQQTHLEIGHSVICHRIKLTKHTKTRSVAGATVVFLVSLSLSQQIVLCSLSRLVSSLTYSVSPASIPAFLLPCRCLSLRHPIPWLLNPRGLPAPAAWTPSLWRCPFGSCTPWQHCCRLSSTAQPPPTCLNPAPASLRLSRHMAPSLRKTRTQPASEAPPPSTRDPFLSPAQLRPGQTHTLHAMLCTGNAGGLNGE